MRRPSPSIALVYAVGVTGIAFFLRDVNALAVVALGNALAGCLVGCRRYWWVLVMYFFSLWGVFLNAYFFANTGEIMWEWGPIVIREGAVVASLILAFRLLTIAGVGIFFLGIIDLREFVRSLEKELRIPSGFAFSMAYSLRLLPLMKKDYSELSIARKERGLRRYPVTPKDLKTLLIPLLGLGIQRALWAGIAAELRGLSLRKVRHEISMDFPDIILISCLVAQIMFSLSHPLLGL